MAFSSKRKRHLAHGMACLEAPAGGAPLLSPQGSAPGPPRQTGLKFPQPTPTSVKKGPDWFLGQAALVTGQPSSSRKARANMLEGWQSALETSCHWVLWGQGCCCPRVAFPAGATRGTSERAQKRGQEGGRGKARPALPSPARLRCPALSLVSRGNKKLLQHHLLITVQSLGLSAKTPSLPGN